VKPNQAFGESGTGGVLSIALEGELGLEDRRGRAAEKMRRGVGIENGLQYAVRPWSQLQVGEFWVSGILRIVEQDDAVGCKERRRPDFREAAVGLVVAMVEHNERLAGCILEWLPVNKIC